jgi:prefoldin alpha subunit
MELNQEQISQARVLENGMKEAEQHLNFIEEQLSELSAFHQNLESLENNSQKQFLASLGKGVYLSGELKSKELLVEIGKGVMIKKSPLEVKKTLEGQIKKLKEAKSYLQNQMDFYLNSLNTLINTIDVSK